MTRTSKEWERIFGKRRFPGAPQRWLQEWINDDHAETAGLMIEVEDPAYGTMIQPGPMVWLEESAEEMLTPEPRREVDFDVALSALTALPTTLPTPADPGDRSGWLDGVRVLDLCNVIAGPHSASYLARFGAEVVKLDPAQPFYDCWNTVIFGLSHMRGKRSVLTDIRSPRGREVLERLVRSVDVVVWNAPDSQVKAMGLDLDGLRSMNPDAVFCQLDCFSGPRRGPRTDYVGYDDLVQAATGIMLRFGGAMETPEEHAHVGTIDVMCGFGGSLGIATALYQKARTGRAGRARTSLSALSGLAQIPFCYDYLKRGLFNEPSGREALGYDALSRFFYTADGFLLLSAYEADAARLDTVEGLKGFSKMPEDKRSVFLAGAFLQATAADWVERLQQADIGAAVCENIEGIRSYNSRPADGTPGLDRGSYSFSTYADHPSGHEVTQLDPYAVRPARSAVRALPCAEKYGASTRAVLAELGFAEEEIAEMFETGAISDSWSREYLPS